MRATLFDARPMAWLLGAALAASVAAGLLLAFGDTLVDPITAGPNTYSFSAIGYRGALELLRKSEVSAERNRDPRLSELSGQAALALLEPDSREATLALVRRLAVAARSRPVVVILPKWDHIPWSLGQHWAQRVWLVPPDEPRKVAAAAVDVKGKPLTFHVQSDRTWYRADSTWGSSYEIELPRARLIEPHQGLRAVVSCPDGWLVASYERPGGGPTYLVSDPDLFNNAGLARADHAPLLLDLVRQLGGPRPVIFDETIHGFRSGGGILSMLLRPPALAVTLQALLVVGVAVWAFAGRFGTPREVIETRRTGREMFVATTARLMTGAADEGAVVERYWRSAVDEVASAFRVPAGEGRAARLLALSSARGASENPDDIAIAVAEVVDGPPRPERWVAVALRIDCWRRETLHGPRRAS